MGVFLEFLIRLQLPNLCPILPISSCRHLCHIQQLPPGPQGHLNQLVLQKFIQLFCLQQSLHRQKLPVCSSLCWTVQISFLDTCSSRLEFKSFGWRVMCELHELIPFHLFHTWYCCSCFCDPLSYLLYYWRKVNIVGRALVLCV